MRSIENRLTLTMPKCGTLQGCSTKSSKPLCTSFWKLPLSERRAHGLTCCRLDPVAIDPNVWSGRALQEVFVELSVAVLHQCIRPLVGAFAPGHHGYQRACVLISGQASTVPFGSPVFACAGKTDPPSLLILSQTSAGNGLLLRLGLAPRTSQFLCSSLGPFLRAGPQNVDRVARRGGQGRPSRLACGGLCRFQAAP